MIRHVNAAKVLAKAAHAGQVDKSGEDYFSGHITRVARSFAYRDKMSEATAYLHDIVEDTVIELSDLEEMGFPPHIVAAVAKLSRERYDDGTKEPYVAYLHRIMDGEPTVVGRLARRIAIDVKTADLKDHLRDTSHISKTLEDRYRKALKMLTGK